MRKHCPVRRAMTKRNCPHFPPTKSAACRSSTISRLQRYVADAATLSRSPRCPICSHLRAGCNAELYRCADSALAQCVARVEWGAWALTDAERTAFEPLRLVHDEQLAAVPAHRFLEALEQGQHAGLRPADRVGLIPKRCLPAMANAPSAWYARMNLQAGAATRGACVDADFDSFYVETLGSGLEVGSCVVKAHHCALRRTG